MDMEFLYFPKDKMEYIPAFISLVIFMMGAVAAMYLIYKKSKKDEKLFDKQFKDNELLQNHIEEHHKERP